MRDWCFWRSGLSYDTLRGESDRCFSAGRRFAANDMLLCSHHSWSQRAIGGTVFQGERERLRVWIDQHYGFHRDVAYTDCVPEQFGIVSVLFVSAACVFLFPVLEQTSQHAFLMTLFDELA